MNMYIAFSHMPISLEVIATRSAPLCVYISVKKADIIVSLQTSFAIDSIQVGCHDKVGQAFPN